MIDIQPCRGQLGGKKTQEFVLHVTMLTFILIKSVQSRRIVPYLVCVTLSHATFVVSTLPLITPFILASFQAQTGS